MSKAAVLSVDTILQTLVNTPWTKTVYLSVTGDPGREVSTNKIEEAKAQLATYLADAFERVIRLDDDPGVPGGPDERLDERDRGWYEGRNQLRAEQRAIAAAILEEIKS